MSQPPARPLATEAESEPSDIQVERTSGVAVVWFNRPAVLNAFRLATFARLALVLEELALAEDVRALVLTGRGRAFCAGEDLEEMNQVAGRGFALAQACDDLNRLQHLTRRLLGYPKPVVAAINGAAVGLGAELPLACDLRIAAGSAYFYFPEAKRGMLQTNGTFRLLPEMVGAGRALEWLLTARRIPAEEARAAGLVSEVSEPARLLERAIELAARAAGLTGRSAG